MVTIKERKLICKVQVSDLAQAEEKAGIVAALEKAGLYVFQNGNTLWVRAEVNDRIKQMPT